MSLYEKKILKAELDHLVAIANTVSGVDDSDFSNYNKKELQSIRRRLISRKKDKKFYIEVKKENLTKIKEQIKDLQGNVETLQEIIK